MRGAETNKDGYNYPIAYLNHALSILVSICDYTAARNSAGDGFWATAVDREHFTAGLGSDQFPGVAGKFFNFLSLGY